MEVKILKSFKSRQKPKPRYRVRWRLKSGDVVMSEMPHKYYLGAWLHAFIRSRDPVEDYVEWVEVVECRD